MFKVYATEQGRLAIERQSVPALSVGRISDANGISIQVVALTTTLKVQQKTLAIKDCPFHVYSSFSTDVYTSYISEY